MGNALEELHLFELLSDAPAEGCPSTDDPLAFGDDGGAIQAFTPQIMTLVSIAVTFLLTKLGEVGISAVKGALEDLGKDLIKDRLRIVLTPKRASTVETSGSPRLVELERTLRLEASRLDIEKEKIEPIVAALLAVLRLER